jgi:hypothetical protein
MLGRLRLAHTVHTEPTASRFPTRYPQTELEFWRRFSTEDDCCDYLEKLRWSKGFRCPKCDCKKAWPTGKWCRSCSECDHKVSLRANTIWDGSRIPLQSSVVAAWYMTDPKNEISTEELQRMFGLRSRQSAQRIFSKLRTAMGRSVRDQLRRLVGVSVCNWEASRKLHAGLKQQCNCRRHCHRGVVNEGLRPRAPPPHPR